MVRIDMNRPIERNLNPGVDLWEIVKAEEKRAKASGALMLKLELARVAKNTDRVFDNVMLEGGGWKIGKAKLAALVGDTFNGELDLLDLIGKRVWLSTGIEVYEGKENLKVLVTDEKQSSGFAWCGIQPAANVPAGHALPGEDTPF